MNDNIPANPQNKRIINNNLLMPRTIRECFLPDECDKILELCESLDVDKGQVGTVDKGGVNIKLRKSEIRWVRPEIVTHWIFNRLRNHVVSLNSFYRYEIRGIESIQIASYSDEGFYDWYIDIGRGIIFNAQVVNFCTTLGTRRLSRWRAAVL